MLLFSGKLGSTHLHIAWFMNIHIKAKVGPFHLGGWCFGAENFSIFFLFYMKNHKILYILVYRDVVPNISLHMQARTEVFNPKKETQI